MGEGEGGGIVRHEQVLIGCWLWPRTRWFYLLMEEQCPVNWNRRLPVRLVSEPELSANSKAAHKQVAIVRDDASVGAPSFDHRDGPDQSFNSIRDVSFVCVAESVLAVISQTPNVQGAVFSHGG